MNVAEIAAIISGGIGLFSCGFSVGVKWARKVCTQVVIEAGNRNTVDR